MHKIHYIINHIISDLFYIIQVVKFDMEEVMRQTFKDGDKIKRTYDTYNFPVFHLGEQQVLASLML
jgi:hypothetical protein